jgi:hypothetical protein
MEPDRLDQALSELAGSHPEQAQVAELRFFAGLSEEETAEAIMSRLAPCVGIGERLATTSTVCSEGKRVPVHLARSSRKELHAHHPHPTAPGLRAFEVSVRLRGIRRVRSGRGLAHPTTNEGRCHEHPYQ